MGLCNLISETERQRDRGRGEEGGGRERKRNIENSAFPELKGVHMNAWRTREGVGKRELGDEIGEVIKELSHEKPLLAILRSFGCMDMGNQQRVLTRQVTSSDLP